MRGNRLSIYAGKQLLSIPLAYEEKEAIEILFLNGLCHWELVIFQQLILA